LSSCEAPDTGQDDLVDLDAVADELYGLPLDDFVSTRATREKQAKAADNKELAAEIHRLAKPNAVGWLVNQLVRHRNADIQALLELGSRMREATAKLSGDLRELSGQQRQVIRGLVKQAEQLAGRPVSADTARSLDETLSAALADPGAAATLAAGRLTAGLRSTGFAGLGTAGSQPARSAMKPRSRAEEHPRTKARGGMQQRERAQAKVARAQALVVEAVEVRDEAQAKLQQAEQSVADARGWVEQLRRELQQAVKAESEAETSRRRAQAAFERADRGSLDAQRRQTDAAGELESLA
jgi:hypothetical protein